MTKEVSHFYYQFKYINIEIEIKTGKLTIFDDSFLYEHK